MPPSAHPSARRPAPDVVIVGDGIAGLTVALALSRRGISSRIVGAPRPGRASNAAAGLLAPSLGKATPGVRAFMLAARDAYPAFLQWLSDAAGRVVELGPRGIIEVARTDDDFAALRAAAPAGALAIDRRIVMELEPSLVPGAGALLHPADGVIDTAELLAALDTAVERDARITVVRSDMARLELASDRAAAIGADGSRHEAPVLVLAAGAWSAGIAGLPRSLPIEPVRGQMLAFEAAPLNHAVMLPGGYLVPRSGRTIVGSTLEHVGFDTGTTPAALDQLARLAASFVHSLTHAPRQPGWAGLRPATPDMLPILGRDPAQPTLVYACGYSKNGILSAPLAAECVAAIVAGERPARDIDLFGVDRFGAA